MLEERGESVSSLESDETGHPKSPRRLRLHKPQDIGAGLIFIVFAVIGLYLSRNYRVGTAQQMGPGYVPRLLCYGLLLMGGIVIVRAFRMEEGGTPQAALSHVMLEWAKAIPWRPLLLISLAVVVFGLTLKYLGLAIAASALILISAFADPSMRPRELVVLTVAMAAFSVVLFIFVLGLPVPVWPDLRAMGMLK